MAGALHMDIVGDGVPAVFVHGSFGWGLDTFPEQRSLGDHHRVILVDRRGFGGSSSQVAEGWPADMHDLASILDEVGPAHLVGQSYGAVVALLAAGLRPHLVRSLVAIEPPAYELARGNQHVDATIAVLKPVFEQAASLSAADFIAAWARATGMPEERFVSWTAAFGAEDWAAVEASRHERWPGDAPIDHAALRAAGFPVCLVRGGWAEDVAGRTGGGLDFAAVCETLSKLIGARLVVFERSSHNPQLQEPEAFNRFLEDLWTSVQPGSTARPPS